MGIIIRQSIRGSVWSYMGVLVGFVTTAYLYPNYLSTDVVGLFGLLLSWSVILAQVFSLGFNGVTARLFPYFRDTHKEHNGFLFLAFIVMFFGFGLFMIFYFIFSPWLIENNQEKSALFSEYVWLLVPLTFFTLLYNLLDSFNRQLYDAVFGTFLLDFLQRAFIILVVILFAFNIINLHQLIIIYAFVVSTKGAIFFFYLVRKGEIKIRPKFHFINKKMGREIINVAIINILAGIGGNLVFNVDKIIVNQMLGLSSTGIYTIAFFFGTLVVIPSRPLLRIAGTLVAEAWKRNDINYISDIYKRSCLNQILIGLFLFGGIWINIDNILIILGPEYAEGKWVIFFIGMGYLIDMATGVNGLVIGYSKYYHVSLWFLLILVGMVFSLMYILIPIMGITGASLAIAISFLWYNLMKFWFLYYKYKMQPFNYKYLLIIGVFLIAMFISFILPELTLVPDILTRSTIYSIVFFLLVYLLPISDELNQIVKQFKAMK
jgi:O-antigen/teichoic acid export membrane protein